jgi:hypothetical protein
MTPGLVKSHGMSQVSLSHMVLKLGLSTIWEKKKLEKIHSPHFDKIYLSFWVVFLNFIQTCCQLMLKLVLDDCK